MPDRIRWGLLSTAKINDALIGPIKESDRSQLVAVASRDLQKAKEYANKKGIPQAYGSYEDLLADPDIHAVYISLPNSMHCEWTVKAAEAGKHVLCEKPIAVSLQELDRMEAAATENGVTLFEAFMYLHHPQTRTAISMIQSGRLGSIQTISSWFHFYLAPENAQNIRLNSDLSGGSLWDIGVYPNSMVITMMGAGSAPEMLWASQIVGESSVDVAMRGQMKFPGDAVGQISCGFRTPFRQGTHIVGDQGMLTLSEPWKPGLAGADSIAVFTGIDGTQEDIITLAVDPYLCEVQAMEACVLDGADPIVPLSSSRDFLRSALAQYESARTGKPVIL